MGGTPVSFRQRWKSGKSKQQTKVAALAEDTQYGEKQSYSAVFDRKGVLYTVAFDGTLRRYVGLHCQARVG